MKTTSYYKAFVAQTPEEILQSVFKNKETVLIGVSLNNGIYIEGTILDISKENNHQKAVCMLSQDEQVSFFNIHSVVFISVKQPKKMVVELSKGAISRPMDSSSQELTVLQLKRWLSNKKELLGSQIKEFNIDNISVELLNTRLNIQDVFTALQNAVNQITKDALGQEAWQGVEVIKIEQADKLLVNLNSKTLTISIAINRALNIELSKQLEEKILQIL